MPAAGGSAARAIERGIRGELIAGLASADKFAQRIARVLPSNKRTERFFVGGTTAQIRKWRDERHPVSIFESFVDLENEHFEGSIRLHRDDVEDEQVPFYSSRIRDLATRAANFEDTRVLGAMTDAAEVTTGELRAGYDGLALLHASHVDPDEAEYTTAQSNKVSVIAAVGTLPNIDECKEGLRQAKAKLRSFKDDRGQPWYGSIPPRLIALVPPDLEQVFLEINGSSTITSGPLTSTSQVAIDNIYRGSLDIIVNPYTANADRVDIIVPDPSGARPYVLARRLAPRLQQVTGDRSGEVDNVAFATLFDMYGVDLRHGVSPDQWRTIVRIQFT